jgi:hypothetical protein
MSKFTETDQEEDLAGNPGPAFVSMDNLVAEKADKERCNGDDQDANPARHVVVDSIEKLRSDDGVYS